MPGPDYILDLEGTGPPRQNSGGGASGQGPAARPGERAEQNRRRPWIAVRWRCCGAYSRVYRNRTGDAYDGRCPRCGRPVRVGVAPGGTSARFFEAG